MKTQKEDNKQEQEVPDALGNDKLQGKDMAKTGHGERVHVKDKKEEDNKKDNKEDTLGIP
ncbi:MAG: hypothetical protein V4658_02445 [Bacteroidota bacterium]